MTLSPYFQLPRSNIDQQIVHATKSKSGQNMSRLEANIVSLVMEYVVVSLAIQHLPSCSGCACRFQECQREMPGGDDRKNMHVRTLFELDSLENSREANGAHAISCTASNLIFFHRTNTGLQHDLIAILAGDSFLLYEHCIQESSDKQNQCIKYVGSIRNSSAFKAVGYVRRWQRFILLTQTGDLCCASLQNISEKRNDSCASTSTEDGQNDIFSDLLKPTSNNGGYKVIDKCFAVLFNRNVITFKALDHGVLTLSYKENTLIIYFLLKTEYLKFQEVTLGQINNCGSGIEPCELVPILLATDNYASEQNGIDFVNGRLLSAIDSSWSCFSNRMFMLIGLPSGHVYSIQIKSILDIEDRKETATNVYRTQEKTFKMLFHQREPIRGIVVSNIPSEKFSFGSTEVVTGNNRERTSVILIIGQQGKIKLVWSSPCSTQLLCIANEHVEGPIIDFSYARDQNYLLTVTCKRITLLRFGWRKDSSNSTRAETVKQNGIVYLQPSSSFPVVNLQHVQLAAFYPSRSIVCFIGINAYRKVIELKISLESAGKEGLKTSSSSAKVGDLLKEAQLNFERKQKEQKRLELQNNALVQLNLVSRIVYQFMREAGCTQKMFHCSTEYFLQGNRNIYSISIVFLNRSSMVLYEGWSLLTKFSYKNFPSTTGRRTVIWHTEVLPTLVANESYGYTIQSSMFQASRLPLTLMFYLAFDRSCISSISSRNISKENVLCFPVWSTEVSVLDIKGSMIQHCAKNVAIPYIHRIATSVCPKPRTQVAVRKEFDFFLERSNNEYSHSFTLPLVCAMRKLLSLETNNSTNAVSDFFELILAKGVLRKDDISSSENEISVDFNGSTVNLSLCYNDGSRAELSKSRKDVAYGSLILKMSSRSLPTLCIYHSAVCQKLMGFISRMDNQTCLDQPGILPRGRIDDLREEVDVTKAMISSSLNEIPSLTSMKQIIGRFCDLLSKMRSFDSI